MEKFYTIDEDFKYSFIPDPMFGPNSIKLNVIEILTGPLEGMKFGYNWYAGISNTEDQIEWRNDYEILNLPKNKKPKMTKEQFDREISLFVISYLKSQELKKTKKKKSKKK